MCELQSNCRFSRDELSKVKCTTAQKRVQISHEESKKKRQKKERERKKNRENCEQHLNDVQLK